MKFLYFIFCTLLIGCMTKKARLRDHTLTVVPPGCIQLDSNRFMDQTEITNLSWLEFMYWTKRVHKNEAIYNKTLPDTSIWLDTTFGFEDFVQMYYRHPRHKMHPVVGLSISQMKAFSKWRSDRVLEMLLIQLGCLVPDQNAVSTKAFSLENLISGNVKLKRKLPKPLYYPQYSIAGIVDYEDAIAYNQKSTKGENLYKCIDVDDTMYYTKKYFNPQERHKDNVFYTQQILPMLKRFYVEQTSDSSKMVNRSWYDSETVTTVHHTDITPKLVGFRNVCKWVEVRFD